MRDLMLGMFVVVAVLLNSQALTDNEISEKIESHRPLKGYVVPKDIQSLLGVTHAGGKYYLTKEPFIIEGSKKIQELGYTTTKYFLGYPDKNGNIGGFSFNSEWNLPKGSSYIDVLQHPYFIEALNCGQTCIVFNIGFGAGGVMVKTDNNYAEHGQEIYELSKYLLTHYKNRDITFMIKNWEGDWMLRGEGVNRQKWMEDPKRALRTTNFLEFTKARQAAVSQARQAVKKTKAKIMFGVESNLVVQSMEGVVGVASDIVPNVELDFVSWSSYDGMNNPVKMYKGIEYLKQQLKPTPYMKGEKFIMIGEIGIPERLSKVNITERWDRLFGAIFAAGGVKKIINWEIYCNEPDERNPSAGKQNDFSRTRTEEELRGFWLIKPDGTISETGIYWGKLLKNGGKTISE